MSETETPTRRCTVSGCDKKHYSKGLCQAHYERKRRTGDVGTTPLRPYGAAGCKVDGCTGEHLALGFCEKPTSASARTAIRR